MRYLLVLVLVFSLMGVCHAELRILGEESPPGEYLDANGNPAGVTIDLVNDLLGRLGVKAAIRILPWKRAYHMGLYESNVALMETTRTEERESLFKWVGPILVVKRIIYGMADYDKPLKTVEDLQQGGTICVLRGSSNERYLQSLGITRMNSVTLPSQCLKMIEADRVQLFYTSEIGMEGLLKEQGIAADKFKALLQLKNEYLYLAFSKDVSDARVSNWQEALEEAKRDGTVAKIYHGVYSEETIKEICVPGDPLAR
jgi:polar amino acid transport system substrate-binding protein